MPPLTTKIPTPLVIFDGVCALCNRTVSFLLQRDTRGELHFTANSSELAKIVLDRYGIPASAVRSIFVFDGERIYQKSDAVIFLCERLGGLLSGVQVFRLIPRFIRDAVYSFIARVRYRVFGRVEHCALLSHEERRRVLE